MQAKGYSQNIGKSNIFNNILTECLDRVIKGDTVKQCLESYPDQARELEPLLSTALRMKTASSIQPRAEFKARSMNEFQAALREIEAKKASDVGNLASAVNENLSQRF